MALMGLPQGSNDGDIKPRIEFDAKAGMWSRVDRSQDAAGMWNSAKTEMEKGGMFIMDLANIEVGWIAFGGGGAPDFRMVPNGTPVGPKPTDGHKAGFRVPVLLPREETARVFASTAKAAIGGMDEIHTLAEAAPEFRAGQVPVVKIAGRKVIETKMPQGTLRNFAPMLEIAKWVDRPAVLGAAPAPAKAAPAAQPAKELEDSIPF
jgi:hypothetical protein